MQDFTKRISIIVSSQNERWQSMNVIAHIGAYLGNKMTEPFDTGEFFTTSDGVNYPRNSQFPIIVLQADSQKLKDLAVLSRESGMPYLTFIREMIETTDDAELQQTLSSKKDSEVEILGVGMFGDNEKVKLLTKGLSLFK